MIVNASCEGITCKYISFVADECMFMLPISMRLPKVIKPLTESVSCEQSSSMS